MIQLDTYRRHAALVIVSQEVTVAEMSEVLGVAPDQALEAGTVRSGSILRIPARENSWEIFEQGDSSADMSDIIANVAQRAIPLRPGLVELRNRGCVIKLDLVQYLSPTDPVGPGFVLDTPMIELLSALDGFVDVDQYV